MEMVQLFNTTRHLDAVMNQSMLTMYNNNNKTLKIVDIIIEDKFSLIVLMQFNLIHVMEDISFHTDKALVKVCRNLCIESVIYAPRG